MAARPIVHVEFSTADPKVSGKFFAEMFGWKLTHSEEMNYTMFDTENGLGGGFPATDENSKPGDVLVYIDSKDIDADLARITAAGGQVLVPKMEIPNTGWFAIFADPVGTRAALYTGMQQ